ncbi:hypothetical protein J2Z83_002033 [Virgibacillus natechei]|uniref:DUF5050 domain-containing protein n=1 Tax=Virgibacillus natechei TaxID=1216297 RepID=A0ABS4IG50_9BACI|nr:hypothetical protein [Virgibacillus natechei]MBP1969925.1 hypothetical protein [Virgibacillus natechei]UZD13410.1 hypothetical protein OLD84_02290 [Virgibacillus natechei]
MKKFDNWWLVLTDGSELNFFSSDKSYSNPLKEIYAFDQGDYWSVSTKGNKKFKADPKNKGSVLVPKHKVVKVYKW